jgi:hypothetical protein
MSDSVSDFLAVLVEWEAEEEDLPLLEGAVDPHRSDESHVLFALDPCRGPWTRIPAEAISAIRIVAERRCGPAAFPTVQVTLSPEAPSALTVIDAVRAGLVASGPARAADGTGLLGGEPAEGSSTHDVRVEVRPDGKLYRIRLHLEGHEVRHVDWDHERKVYVAEIQGLPVEDSLDVVLQAWGNQGATLTLSVEVDGRAMKPTLQATVTDRPGEARRSYSL